MPSILLKFSVILLTSLGLCHANSFGSRAIDWSSTESADFRDYVVRAFNSERSINNDYWAHFWLNQKVLEFRLASTAPLAETLALNLQAESVNAFAIPGNVIAMHKGLWRFADSEAEFLSVVAHEIAHITQDHFTRHSSNSNNQGLVVATGILLSILLAQENPDAANATLMSSIASANQNRLSFTQTMELEADHQARQLLKAAGYDADAGRSFFQKLEQASQTDSSLEFLRSHPLGTTRASRLSDQSNQPLTAQTELTSFDLIRHQMLNNGNLKEFARLDELTKQARTVNDPNLKYALALFNYQQTGDITRHLAALSDLISAHRGFLPAHHSRLLINLQQNTAQMCRLGEEFERLITDESVTITVLETMKTAGEECNWATKTEWQAKWLWQSGQEEQALQLLRSSLTREKSTNQVARHSALLAELERRYQRFL